MMTKQSFLAGEALAKRACVCCVHVGQFWDKLGSCEAQSQVGLAKSVGLNAKLTGIAKEG